jgi:hypothetical protein
MPPRTQRRRADCLIDAAITLVFVIALLLVLLLAL